jgi:hypothetical protein
MNETESDKVGNKAAKRERTAEEKAARKARKDARNTADVKDSRPEGSARDSRPEDDFTHYVHLADGRVVTVNEGEGELPAPGGTNSPLGHHVVGGHVYDVIGVYPREHKHVTEESK